MSHLTPHRSVRITPGGSAVSPAAAGPPASHDTSWEGLIADLARAIDLEPDWFAAMVDLVVFELAKRTDLEVARTRLRAALLGNTAMVEVLVDVDLSEQAISEKASEYGGGDGGRVVAVLAILHRALVAPEIPPGRDDSVGEGSGGSAAPLPVTDPDVHVGQVGYTLDAVPRNAKDVILWIGDAETGDDRRARAQAAQEVETNRPDGIRTTVAQAIAGVLDG